MSSHRPMPPQPEQQQSPPGLTRLMEPARNAASHSAVVGILAKPVAEVASCRLDCFRARQKLSKPQRNAIFPWF
jgi:hypothetical protein